MLVWQNGHSGEVHFGTGVPFLFVVNHCLVLWTGYRVQGPFLNCECSSAVMDGAACFVASCFGDLLYFFYLLYFNVILLPLICLWALSV